MKSLQASDDWVGFYFEFNVVNDVPYHHTTSTTSTWKAGALSSKTGGRSSEGPAATTFPIQQSAASLKVSLPHSPQWEI